MPVVLLTLITSFFLLFSPILSAKSLSGFHKGPYLQGAGGIMQADFDTNQRTKAKTGNDFEPCAGIAFGWNFFDNFGSELLIRYATNKNSVGGEEKREHFVNTNIHGRLYLVSEKLTRSQAFKILPYIQGGIFFQIAAVPGDPTSGDSTLSTWGVGPSIGAGVNFLSWKYFYTGLQIIYDVPHITSRRQSIGGVNTTIIDGGWHPLFGALGLVGVHF